MRVLALLAIWVLSAAAFADDEVKLKNGDRETGTVASPTEGKFLGGVISEVTPTGVSPTVRKTDDTYTLGPGYVF